MNVRQKVENIFSGGGEKKKNVGINAKMWVIEYETATSLRSSIRLEVSEFVKIIIKYQVPNKRAE